MKRLFPTGPLVLLLASLTLAAQTPVPAPPKLPATLLERSARSPNEPVVVHLLLNPAALYRASTETNANRPARRSARAPATDLLADAAAARVEFAGRAAELLAVDANAVSAEVGAANGRVLYRALSSADLVVVVPAWGLPRLAALPQVMEIVEDVGLQGGLDVSVPTIGATSFWNAGEYGSNVKVGILDSGVDLTNPLFNGVAAHSSVYQASAQVADPNCYADVASPDDLQGHGSHVAGIVFSRGASQCPGCRGVANGAELWNLKAGYKSTCSNTPSVRWADAQQAVSDTPSVQVYNMSYGTPYTCDTNNVKYSCDDDAQSRTWDATVDTKNQAVTICAGNDALNGGTNTLWAPAIAYNVIGVANVNDQGTTYRGDDVVYASSSYGPTAGGRKKPDLAAPGTSIESANYNWEGGAQLVRMTGTSMAAPHVAGAMALLLNAAATENIPALLDPRSLKAVLINSAEQRNGLTGWDAHWGWGYLDAANAYQHRTAVFLDSVSAAAGPGSARLYAGSTAGNAGKATLVWNRHPYNVYNCPSGVVLLNNLDLFAYDEADGSLLGSSASTVDNVEQVIASGKSKVVLRVADVCSGFAGTEQYALATENGFAPASPSLRLHVLPQNFAVGGHATVSVEAYNDGDIAAQDVQVTLNLPAGMSLDAGAAGTNIPRLAAHSSTLLTWQVGAPVQSGFYGAGASAASTSYGASFSASAVQNWSVGTVANFVMSLARPARQMRSTTTPIVVAGTARVFEIVVNGVAPSTVVSPRCEAPEGVECDVVAKGTGARRRLIASVRPADGVPPAMYTANVSVEADGASADIELPFAVRRAPRAKGSAVQ